MAAVLCSCCGSGEEEDKIDADDVVSTKAGCSRWARGRGLLVL